MAKPKYTTTTGSVSPMNPGIPVVASKTKKLAGVPLAGPKPGKPIVIPKVKKAK